MGSKGAETIPLAEGDERSLGSIMRPYIAVALLFTCVSNFLLLVPPLHMLQVYDRVLISGSRDTLILITIIAVFLLLVYGFAELGRRRALSLAAISLKSEAGPTILRSALNSNESEAEFNKRLAELRSLNGFVAGGLTLALLDSIFLPLFLIALFLVHPVMGYFGVFSAISLLVLAVVTNRISESKILRSEQADQAEHLFSLNASRMNQTIKSLGMISAVENLLRAHQTRSSQISLSSSQNTGLFSSVVRAFRNILQILMLSLGAILVLQQQTSAGAIVAGSIMLGKALAPIDQCVGGWRQIVYARRAIRSISNQISGASSYAAVVSPLPKPSAELIFEGVEIGILGSNNIILPQFNLRLQGGTILALVGRSGSGKSTLLKTIAGVLPLQTGSIKLGGRDIHAWDSDDRGRFIGYSSSDADLLPVSVLANICRLREVPLDDVYKLTSSLGVHQTILSLSNGYDTVIEHGKPAVSAGQAQAISLARAFLGQPSLLLLDEPTAHLDNWQIQYLQRKFQELAKAGSIIIVATHDMRIINASSHVLPLNGSNPELITKKEFRQRLLSQSNDRPKVAEASK